MLLVITKEHKTKLSELLAAGHGKFGRVAPRQPYREDDDEGGGEGGFRFDTHPFLEDQPEGASSDLSMVVNDHGQSDLADEVDKHADNISNDLQARPAFQQTLGAGQAHTVTATPNPLGR